MPTFNADLVPDSSGRSLGLNDARWDAQIRNLNVSGAVTGNFAGLAIFTLPPTVVPWSATPLFNGLTKSTGFKIVLAGDTPGPAFINLPSGQLVSMVIIQDNTGGRSFTWPANVRGGMDIGTLPNELSAQLFWFDGTILIALTPGNIS